jgi:hypothetical protein
MHGQAAPGLEIPGQHPIILRAEDIHNTKRMNGDLDATVLSDTGYYYLRDFATTGDAIRIKLPYIDPSKEFPEYIWIENHNGKNMNGVEFDTWQYQDAACVYAFGLWIYMYLQIDKDVRQSVSLK